MAVLAKHVDRLDTIGRVIFLLLAAAWVVIVFYLSLVHPSTSSVELFLRQLLFVACIFPLQVGFLYLKEYNYKKLTNFLREEEARTFLPYGFVLECHDELLPMDMDRTYGYYLYFIRSTKNGNDNNDLSPPEMSCRRGYLRVQVVNGRLCSWNTSPALPYYDYLPDVMVSLSLADWSEFWSKMDIVSSTAVSSIRGFQLIVWLFLIWMFGMLLASENDTVFLVGLIVGIPVLSLHIYYLGRIRAIDSDIQNVCNEYADQFAQQGVYLEFRREHDWTARSCLTRGGTMCRYIYLFPDHAQS
jgi:hypothetical protein